MFPILQKSVNDEQYEIYKGPGTDGHVTSNLRIKALRVRFRLEKIKRIPTALIGNVEKLKN